MVPIKGIIQYLLTQLAENLLLIRIALTVLLTIALNKKGNVFVDFKAVMAPKTVVKGEIPFLLVFRVDQDRSGTLHIYNEGGFEVDFSLIERSESNRYLNTHLIISLI